MGKLYKQGRVVARSTEDARELITKINQDAGYLVERLIEIEPCPVQPYRELTWYEYLAEVEEYGQAKTILHRQSLERPFLLSKDKPRRRQTMRVCGVEKATGKANRTSQDRINRGEMRFKHTLNPTMEIA